MTLRTLTLAGAVILMFGAPLAACGKLGALQKPSALSGADRATEDQHPAQDPLKPMETIDPRDRGNDPPPPSPQPSPDTPQR